MNRRVASLLLTIFACPATGMCAPIATSDVPPALTERWWHWRVALPELATPDKDPTGRFCDTGQTGDVWFLAGHLSLGDKARMVARTCVVPAHTRLLFPVVTKTKFAHGSVTCEEAKAQAAAEIDGLTDMFVEVDDIRLPESAARRVKSDACFALNLSPGSKSAPMAAADGYWVSLDPLPPGKHVLVYGGRYADPKLAGSSQLSRYVIDVK